MLVSAGEQKQRLVGACGLGGVSLVRDGERGEEREDQFGSRSITQ